MDQIIPNEILIEISLFSDIPTRGRLKQYSKTLNNNIIFMRTREIQRLKRLHQLRKDNKYLKLIMRKKIEIFSSYRLMKNDNILPENIPELIEKGYICSNSIQKNPNLQKDDLVKYPQYFKNLTTIYLNPNFRMEDLPFPENLEQWFYLSKNPNLTKEIIVKYKDKWSKKLYRNLAMSPELYSSMNLGFNLKEEVYHSPNFIKNLHDVIIYSKREDFYEEFFFKREAEFTQVERDNLRSKYLEYKTIGRFPRKSTLEYKTIGRFPRKSTLENMTIDIPFNKILENPESSCSYMTIRFNQIYGDI